MTLERWNDDQLDQLSKTTETLIEAKAELAQNVDTLATQMNRLTTCLERIVLQQETLTRSEQNLLDNQKALIDTELTTSESVGEMAHSMKTLRRPLERCCSYKSAS
jgi:chromosome segregation ATPase